MNNQLLNNHELNIHILRDELEPLMDVLGEVQSSLNITEHMLGIRNLVNFPHNPPYTKPIDQHKIDHENLQKIHRDTCIKICEIINQLYINK